MNKLRPDETSPRCTPQRDGVVVHTSDNLDAWQMNCLEQFLNQDVSLYNTNTAGIVADWKKECAGTQCVYIRQKLSPYLLRWRNKYDEEMKDLRDCAVENTQEQFTLRFQNILRSMLLECFALIGEPPAGIRFGWFGLGSLSRAEVLPYSKLQYLLLFEESDMEVREYFHLVHSLIALQVHSLSEQAAFPIDGSLTMSEVMHDRLKKEVILPMNIAQAAHHVCALVKSGTARDYAAVAPYLNGRFIAGDETIWGQFEKRIQDQIGAASKRKFKTVSELCREILLSSSTDFDAIWRDVASVEYADHLNQLDVNTFGDYFSTLCDLLKKIYPMKAINFVQVFRWLAEAKVVPANAETEIVTAWKALQMMRMRLQHHYKADSGTFHVVKTDVTTYMLTEEDAALLNDCLGLLRRMSSHLRAIRAMEKAGNEMPVEIDDAMQKNITQCHALGFLLVSNLRIPKELAQDSLFRVLSHQYCADPRVISLLLSSGADAREASMQTNALPTRLVLAWAEKDPARAAVVWRLLIERGADAERRTSFFPNTVLEQAIAMNAVNSFITLVRLGSGRYTNANLLRTFIARQMGIGTFIAEMLECKALLIQQNNRFAFEMVLKEMIFYDGELEKSSHAIESAARGVGYLSNEVATQLFDNLGELRKPVVNHAVWPLKVGDARVFAKFYPEFPGMEEAVRCCATKLFDSGIAQSELFKLKDRKGAVYSVLLSQEIVGETLQDVLMERAKWPLLDELDNGRLTQMILLMLLTNPEDAKAENFVLSPYLNIRGERKYQIVGVDNDHSFVRPVIRESKEKRLQVKCILFCLDQIHRILDAAVLQEFVSLNPETFILDWLSSLIETQTKSEVLFTTQDRNTLAQKYESFIQIPFSSGSIIRMYERWVAISDAVVSTEKTGITGMQLLNRIKPILGFAYAESFEQISSPLERFRNITATSYEVNINGKIKTKMTPKKLLLTQSIKEKELVGAIYYTPQRCKIDLLQFLESRKSVQADTEFLCNALTHGNLKAYDAFVECGSVRTKALRSLKWDQIPSAKQVSLLSKLVEVGNLQEVELFGCSALNESVLESLLKNSPQLASLVIDQEKYPKKLNTLSLLKKYSMTDTLQRLSFIGDANLKSLDGVAFPSLKFLQLKNCPNLSSIALEAYSLEVCILDCLPILSAIVLPFPQKLRDLKISTCFLLDTEILTPIFKWAYELHSKTLQIDNCPLVDRTKIDLEFASHPVLLRLLQDALDSLFAFNYSAALVKYNKVLAIEPNCVTALIRKSCILYSLGKFNESFATASYLTNHISRPKDIDVLLQKQIKEAKVAWHQASQSTDAPMRASESFSIWIATSMLYCRCLIIQKYFQEAIAEVEKLKMQIEWANVPEIRRALALAKVADFYYFELQQPKIAVPYYENLLGALRHDRVFTDSIIATHRKLAKIEFKEGKTLQAFTRYSFLASFVTAESPVRLAILIKLVRLSKAVKNYEVCFVACKAAFEALKFNRMVNWQDCKLQDYVFSAMMESTLVSPWECVEVLKDMHHNGIEDALTVLGKYAARNHVKFIDSSIPITPKILAAKNCLEYFITQSLATKGGVRPRYYMQLAKIYFVARNHASAGELFAMGFEMYRDTENSPEDLGDKIEFYETYGKFLEWSHEHSKAFAVYLLAHRCLEKYHGAPLPSSAFDLAKLNLAHFSREMGLAPLVFDENSTCILSIDEEFSLHLTYEPLSQRLYLYSPLLDGLPAEPEVLSKLYEALLDGAMLGGGMAGGGCGLALKEELILFHHTLELTDQFSLARHASLYVECVEHWRKVCRLIVNCPIPNLSTLVLPKLQFGPSAFGSWLSVKRQENIAKLRTLLLKCESNLACDIDFDASFVDYLSKAQALLAKFAEKLSVPNLVFDENNSCILSKDDDDISIHLTFEPNSRRLYIYSPVLDGLPASPDQRLSLYEHILGGSMLGAQMAGGGVGIAMKEELVLLHCTIQVTDDPNSLRDFAPTFLETIEKWRAAVRVQYPERVPTTRKQQLLQQQQSQQQSQLSQSQMDSASMSMSCSDTASEMSSPRRSSTVKKGQRRFLSKALGKVSLLMGLGGDASFTTGPMVMSVVGNRHELSAEAMPSTMSAEIQPKLMAKYKNRAIAHRDAHNLESCIRYCDLSLCIDTRNFELLDVKARALWSLNDLRGALISFMQIQKSGYKSHGEDVSPVELKRRTVSTLSAMTTIYFKLGYEALANTHLQEALLVDPDSPQLLNCIYGIYLAEGKYQQACETAGRIMEIHALTTTDTEAVKNYVIDNYVYQIAVQSGNWSEVEDFLKLLRGKHDEPTADWCRRFSQEHYRRAHFEDALIWADKAISLSKSRPFALAKAMLLKVSCLEKLGRFDEAKVLWTIVTSRPVDSVNISLFYSYATDYLMNGPTAESLDHAIRLCQRGEEMPMARAIPYHDMIRAMAYAKKGDFESSKRYLANVLQADTRDIDEKILACCCHAEVMFLQEEYGKAVEILMRYIYNNYRSQSRYAEIVIKVVKYLSWDNQPSEALALLGQHRELMEQFPCMNSESLEVEATTYMHSGDYTKALQCIEMIPVMSCSQLALTGYIHYKMEDPTKADEFYARALAMSPRDYRTLKWRRLLAPSLTASLGAMRLNLENLSSSVADTESSLHEQQHQVIVRDCPSPRRNDKPGLVASGSLSHLAVLTDQYKRDKSNPVESLFTENFQYSETFKHFSDRIMNFLTAKENTTVFALASNLSNEAKTKLYKAILADALELPLRRIEAMNAKLIKLNAELKIGLDAKTLGAQHKKKPDELIQLLLSYLAFLNEQHETTETESLTDLKFESDLATVLLASLKEEIIVGKKWKEKKFFSTLNAATVQSLTNRQLHDPKLTFMEKIPKVISLSLKDFSVYSPRTLSISSEALSVNTHTRSKAWQCLYVLLKQRIDIEAYERSIEEHTASRKEFQSRYAGLLDAFKSLSSLPSTDNFIDFWLYNVNAECEKFGGFYGLTINSGYHVSHELNPKERLTNFHSAQLNFSAAMGTLYFGTEKSQEREKCLVLDANYQIGQCGATTDGVGHYDSLEAQRVVQESAYQSAKLASRYCNLYTVPSELYEDATNLMNTLVPALQQSFERPQDAGSASVVVTKYFPEQQVLLSLGLGDCMVALYTPSSRMIHTLVKPRQYQLQGNLFQPAAMSEKLCVDAKMQKSYVRLEEEAVLIRMTDGAWQMLPHRRSQVQYDENAKCHYIEYQIHSALFSAAMDKFQLAPTPTSKDYLTCFMQIIQRTWADCKEIVERYTQRIEAIALLFLSAESGHTVGDFVTWLEKTENPFYSIFLSCIEILNYEFANLKDIPIEDFRKGHINFGDDVTMHVELISPGTESPTVIAATQTSSADSNTPPTLPFVPDAERRATNTNSNNVAVPESPRRASISNTTAPPLPTVPESPRRASASNTNAPPLPTVPESPRRASASNTNAPPLPTVPESPRRASLVCATPPLPKLPESPRRANAVPDSPGRSASANPTSNYPALRESPRRPQSMGYGHTSPLPILPESPRRPSRPADSMIVTESTRSPSPSSRTGREPPTNTPTTPMTPDASHVPVIPKLPLDRHRSPVRAESHNKELPSIPGQRDSMSPKSSSRERDRKSTPKIRRGNSMRKLPSLPLPATNLSSSFSDRSSRSQRSKSPSSPTANSPPLSPRSDTESTCASVSTTSCMQSTTTLPTTPPVSPTLPRVSSTTGKPRSASVSSQSHTPKVSRRVAPDIMLTAALSSIANASTSSSLLESSSDNPQTASLAAEITQLLQLKSRLDAEERAASKSAKKKKRRHLDRSATAGDAVLSRSNANTPPGELSLSSGGTGSGASSPVKTDSGKSLTVPPDPFARAPPLSGLSTTSEESSGLETLEMWLERHQISNIKEALASRCEVTKLSELLEFDEKTIQFIVDGCEMKALTKVRFLKGFELLKLPKNSHALTQS